MYLLTDGTDSNPVLAFCLQMISQHAANWPPTDQALADEFVKWLEFKPIQTRDRLKQLCEAKGVNLSFAPLPPDIRGWNYSFGKQRRIIITEPETAPLADSHTLLHEFREMLEHVFVELGHPTIEAKDDREMRAEKFAIACRIKAGEKELPAFLEMASCVEKKWARYLSFAFVFVSMLAYFFICITTPQMEEALSEAKRQRYIHM